MSLLFGFWRLPIALGNNTGNTLGNKQKIFTQKILPFLRARNYKQDKEKNKYKPIITIEYFKIPSYEKLLSGVRCPCFCHDHDNMCYIKEEKLCKICPCWFFKTLI